MKKHIKRRPKIDISGLEGTHPVIAHVFASRGVSTTSELNYRLDQLLTYDDFHGIERAVQRITAALQANEKIVIVGDYDADGATSTAVAISALQMFGATALDFIVPNRFSYGYGLSVPLVDDVRAQGGQVIITVDNGIASHAAIDHANQLGIDVIVTDHHLAAETLPKAFSIVNPNQSACDFPSKNLAGVGVIFYVMLALRKSLMERDWFDAKGLPLPNMGSLLDYVALGTIADVVPLDQNNRLLAYQGLARIRAGRAHPGIYALLAVAERDPQYVYASDLAFAVAPRLNAAGRLDDMGIGIQCLLANTDAEALSLAKKLHSLNHERREIEANMKKEAFAAIDKWTTSASATIPFGVSLYETSWHQGVIGIVAGRIKDHIHRPVVAFANDNDTLIKGSARSIPGVHIRDVLARVDAQHPHIIEKFGGHAMAAGLTIKKDCFAEFTHAFNDAVSEAVDDSLLENTILSDGELSGEDLSLSFAYKLRDAGPWGQAFTEPLFDGVFTLIEQRIVGRTHLKVMLEDPKSGIMIDGIAFNVTEGEWPNYRTRHVHIAYRLDVNRFRERDKVQLLIEHIIPTSVDVSAPMV